MKAEIVIQEYMLLQERLVRSLFETKAPKDHEYFRDLVDGELSLDGIEWTFRKHGAGILFRSARGVVDAHVGSARFPSGVDAWRLLEYCESHAVALLEFGNGQYSATEERELERLLEAMARKGTLKKIVYQTIGTHILYVSSEGSADPTGN